MVLFPPGFIWKPQLEYYLFEGGAVNMLDKLPRPIIAALGDISSVIREDLVEALCAHFADTSSIVFLGHLTDNAVALPQDVIWVPEDPVRALGEGNVDCIICPYRSEEGIDERVFTEDLEIPVVTFFPVKGKDVHIVQSQEEFVREIEAILSRS